MRHPRIIIASVSLAAAAAIGGGITAAAATTSQASSQPAASQAAAATVRTVQATVGGKTETILVNSQGLPLYYYLADTAAKSVVTGGLARAVAAADVWVTGCRWADRQALPWSWTSTEPGRLQRAPAVHLRRRRSGEVTGQGARGFSGATPGATPSPAISPPAKTVRLLRRQRERLPRCERCLGPPASFIER